MHNKIVFIQKRPNRGGAQVALSRLLSAPEMRDLSPLVIMGSPGWLSDECRRLGIKTLVTSVPSVRSLAARLWGIRSFVENTLGRLAEAPLAIIANNHQEAILAAALARRLRTRSAVILRDSYLTINRLQKYGWDEPDHALAVGAYLERLATNANASVPVTHLYDSVTDFIEPKKKPDSFPKAALVVGSPAEQKGWRAWIAAVENAIRIEPDLENVRFDFTGEAPDSVTPSKRFRFGCRDENFGGLVRGYDLIVNPSQSESFGLAGAEALAFGVPLLTTSVGVLGSEIKIAPQMIMGGSSEKMSESLCSLYRGWRDIDPMVAESQKSIRAFSASRAAGTVIDCMYRMQRGE
jgi:glycosyltransferase involved in cell wall biosynthesis